jgi:hypothetical protein
MIRVVCIESPYAAPTPEGIARNRRYLDACILDCVRRGETPYASHKMLTDALNDADAEAREMGIVAGFQMREVLAIRHSRLVTVEYVDLGISRGMLRGVEHSESLQVPVEVRQLGGEWSCYSGCLR